ncbi:MAG: cupin domain-containing protein [Cellvibrionaceae bacterium]
MSLFSPLTNDTFLNEYWQQRPLVVRQTLNDLSGIIDGDELAGLACEEDVESRIIQGYELNHHWSCSQGPFSADDFTSLPEQNWTLLVQGLDQWVDEISDILKRFSFLPRWRLEDIMASYAPIGGGVGPHFDYYDVFLIQVSGKREWKLGQKCNEDTPLQKNNEVKLLQEFLTEETHELSSGDMLYIPSGVSHWGRALSDDCITLSVGFRAPSEKELLTAALEDITSNLSNHKRYQDTIESIDSDPNKINTHVYQKLSRLLASITAEDIQASVEKVFGELVTEPRYGADEQEQSFTLLDLKAIFDRDKEIILESSNSCRMAFSKENLFVNGESYLCDEVFSREFCDGSIINLPNDEQFDLLLSFIDSGDIFVLN